MKKKISDREQINVTLKGPKKKKWVPVVIVIAILWIIGTAIGGGSGNDDKEKGSAEKVLDANSDIIWKDDDNMGIVNLKLDGESSKQVIRLDYFEKVADYVNALDKNKLKDYSHIEFKGNVMKEGKIECTILGNLSLEYLKSASDISGVDVENNLSDLRIPKPLQ